jgi:hypothetical protein
VPNLFSNLSPATLAALPLDGQLPLDLRRPPAPAGLFGGRRLRGTSQDLEALRGDLKGRHSIRVNDQWRLVFRPQGNDAHEVRLTDYP